MCASHLFQEQINVFLCCQVEATPLSPNSDKALQGNANRTQKIPEERISFIVNASAHRNPREIFQYVYTFTEIITSHLANRGGT